MWQFSYTPRRFEHPWFLTTRVTGFHWNANTFVVSTRPYYLEGKTVWTSDLHWRVQQSKATERHADTTPKTSISSERESSTFHGKKYNARTHIGIVQPSCTRVAVLDYLPAVGPWVGNTAHPPTKPSSIQNSTVFSQGDSRVKMWKFSDISGTSSVPISRVCWWFGATFTSWRRCMPEKFPAIRSQRKLQDLYYQAFLIVSKTTIVSVCINAHRTDKMFFYRGVTPFRRQPSSDHAVPTAAI
jgi:hypothetical protein